MSMLLFKSGNPMQIIIRRWSSVVRMKKKPINQLNWKKKKPKNLNCGSPIMLHGWVINHQVFFLFFFLDKIKHLPKNLNCGFSAIVTWWSGPHRIMSPAFLSGKKAWAVWAPCITGLGYNPDFYLKQCLWAHSYRHGLNPCCPFYDFLYIYFLIYPF
jgi:hypothetical protein